MISYKKLYIIILSTLSMGSLYSTHNQTVFNFAVKLSRQKSKNIRSIAQWLFTENVDDKQVILIINSPLTFQEKIQYLKRIQPCYVTRRLKNIHRCINKPIKTGLKIIGIAVAVSVIPSEAIFSGTMNFLLARKLYHDTFETKSSNV